MRGALGEIYSKHCEGMQSGIFCTFHNPRWLVFNYALLIHIVHVQSVLVIARVPAGTASTEGGGNAANGLTNTADN